MLFHGERSSCTGAKAAIGLPTDDFVCASANQVCNEDPLVGQCVAKDDLKARSRQLRQRPPQQHRRLPTALPRIRIHTQSQTHRPPNLRRPGPNQRRVTRNRLSPPGRPERYPAQLKVGLDLSQMLNRMIVLFGRDGTWTSVASPTRRNPFPRETQKQTSSNRSQRCSRVCRAGIVTSWDPQLCQMCQLRPRC